MKIVRSLNLLLVIGLTSAAFNSLAEAVTVDVFTPSPQQQREILPLSGSITAKNQANLASLESGVVAKLWVDVGTVVAKGDKLLTLDDTLAQLELAQRQASLAMARIQVDEATRLLAEIETQSATLGVAKTQIGARKAAVASAKALAEQAQAAVALQQEVVARHTLRAPFAGVIATRDTDLGEWVSPQTTVLSLVAKTDLRLTVNVPQQYYQRFLQHQIAVTVIPDFAGALPITATDTRIVATANSNNRTFVAQIDLPQQHAQATALIAGMSATAQITFGSQHSQQVWLPLSAIKQHPDGGRSVFAVENNQAKRFAVTVIETQGDKVAVEGLNTRLPVVLSGVALLRDGDALQVDKVHNALAAIQEKTL